ncbi:biosynthetic arginine decarboxylase [Epibacterium ulvae]|uniref:biosynthetic arginine decarboxylase n=1 Tax=Epibacterium ulvae TaxID=1156985 RepID=UPI001E2B3BFD|nr:biosynthetic arginine decarboxylase [Epibacterium ulvae]
MLPSQDHSISEADQPTDKIFGETYGLHNWGDDLVTVDATGAVCLGDPTFPDGQPTPLPKIMADLSDRGIVAPVLLRVDAFLDRALAQLNTAFAEACTATRYQGVYRGVFPIKVNQQAEVIKQLVRSGRRFNYGLEAGSKPELLIALAQDLPSDALLICNGFKDEDFIRLAILSRHLGHNTVIVIESLDEFDIIQRVSADLNRRPLLGVRVKLTERVTGKWQESSGDRSTFGLSAFELMALITRMKNSDFLDCLVLQHSHLGSQVPDIIDVRRATTEACRFYTELTNLGAPLTHIDLGGGLGVDYTGARRADDNSVNYSVDEYCYNIVETLRYALDEAEIPHPTIVTESGRFVVAQSSIFVFNVLGATLYDAGEKPDLYPEDHHLLADLMAVEHYIDGARHQEALNDAVYYRDEMRALFRRGQLNLDQLSRGEQIFLYLSARLKLRDTEENAAFFIDHYHGNFSLFQSLPDVWAIDQLHPILPLQRLNEAPTRHAIINDITCDSDGKIDRFILGEDIASALPVHDLVDDQPYYVGAFFVGAYQETLGDLHNLFGDANVITISLDGAGGFSIVNETEADSIAEVLSYVEYDPRDCLDAVRQKIERAVVAGLVEAETRRLMISAYKKALNGSTYFEQPAPRQA